MPIWMRNTEPPSRKCFSLFLLNSHLKTVKTEPVEWVDNLYAPLSDQKCSLLPISVMVSLSTTRRAVLMLYRETRHLNSLKARNNKWRKKKVAVGRRSDRVSEIPGLLGLCCHFNWLVVAPETRCVYYNSHASTGTMDTMNNGRLLIHSLRQFWLFILCFESEIFLVEILQKGFILSSESVNVRDIYAVQRKKIHSCSSKKKTIPVQI